MMIRRDSARIRAKGEPVAVHAYIDTGMSRMGIPYHRAMPFLRAMAGIPHCRLTGTFMTFTEDASSTASSWRGFRRSSRDAAAAGISLGKLHAASSHSIFHHRDVGFDLRATGDVALRRLPGQVRRGARDGRAPARVPAARARRSDRPAAAR